MAKSFKIAICDDEDECVVHIERYLEKFICSNKTQEIKWESFYSAEELLDNYEQNGKEFEVLITDIEMKQLNGVDLANRIRSIDKNIVIFFLTSHTEYAIQCFRPEPMNFWVKPVSYDIFAEDLCRAVQRINKAVRYISIVEERHTIRLNIENIVYIEKEERKTLIHMINGVHKTNKLLSQFEDELPTEMFVRIYQSYIVNIAFVKLIKEKYVILKDTEQSLDVGRTYVENLKHRFIEYKERKAFGNEYL
ncbi:MAG: LytTR family DNA-binding domain-containing protein [bacterium]|nr:LytTR family DNA-binding domain-containing protein [bacterium]